MLNVNLFFHRGLPGIDKSMDKKSIITIVSAAYSYFMDDDSEEETEISLQLLKMKKIKKPRTCLKNYDDIILLYSPSEFRSHFRLEKTTVSFVIERFGKDIYQSNPKGGRPSNPTKQFLVALWMLSNQESLRLVADRFDLCIAAAWTYFQKIVEVLVKHVQDYIKWPMNLNTVSRKFKLKAGIDNVVGAIDGSHISIVTPSFMPNSYLNRKQFHSVILQGVCDSDYIFTDCSAGYPGSIHDARVYRMSPLSRHLPRLIDENHHILGDSAYPNNNSLITPYKDNGYLTANQKKFNFLHSKTRVCIEQAFGLLKGRFRILKHINITRTEFIPKVIIACCILHNICMNCNDTNVEVVYDEAVDDDRVAANDILVADDTTSTKRDILCNMVATS